MEKLIEYINTLDLTISQDMFDRHDEEYATTKRGYSNRANLDSEYLEDMVIENTWAVHQMNTTVNFANNNFWLNWYAGGLNFQVEHHLFPNICHIHYKKISKIVKETAKEFNVPYHEQPSFTAAIWNHAKMLKKLGRA